MIAGKKRVCRATLFLSEFASEFASAHHMKPALAGKQTVGNQRVQVRMKIEMLYAAQGQYAKAADAHNQSPIESGERVFVGLCTPFPPTRRPTRSDHSYLHKVTDSPAESNASAARIISRVDDIRDPRARCIELHDNIGLGHRKVGHGRGDRAEIAGMHARKFRFVEFVTYSHRESALEYRHIFSGRVPVWRNHGPRGGLLADHEGTGFSGVARYDRYLRAGDDRFPLQVIRGDDSMRICAACDLHCSD